MLKKRRLQRLDEDQMRQVVGGTGPESWISFDSSPDPGAGMGKVRNQDYPMDLPYMDDIDFDASTL